MISTPTISLRNVTGKSSTCIDTASTLIFIIHSNKVDDDSYCHTFDFIIGVIFYDTTSAYPLFELISTYGVEQINSLSYTISVDAIEGSLSNEQRIEAYNFCDLSFGPCNVRFIYY